MCKLLVKSTQLYATPVTEAETKTLENKHLKTEAAEPILKTPNSVEFNSEITSRLEQIELTLTSLQDTKQKTEDDISELKQWRDNFVTEQNDMVVKVDQLSKKQKQNFKNMRKQLKDYDDNQKKSNLEIEYLLEKESFLSKTLENLSIDIKENESNFNKLNKEMQLQTDKTSVLIQEIKSQTNSMSDLQEEQKKRAMQTANQIMTITSALDVIEHKLLEISLNNQIKSQPQVKPSPIGFVASLGRIQFGQTHFQHIERNEGNHFYPNTGEFIAPVDGLYKASLTIKQTGDGTVRAGVGHRSGRVVSWLGDVCTQDKSVETSRTFEFHMKTGDVLFIQNLKWPTIKCTHFSCFLVDI
ncbi:uncharacterized protein LOC131957633 [Physella acuta]|uniref:uncharacterized protein LOC131957633 n=1 Tax=Physella acuta TaxID=109671 RepID=UPI0027DD0C74|nr:uncharacterized protein LOC131957633 [Physella acuta]